MFSFCSLKIFLRENLRRQLNYSKNSSNRRVTKPNRNFNNTRGIIIGSIKRKVNKTVSNR